MTSDSGVAHPDDSASGPAGCPRYRETPISQVLSARIRNGEHRGDDDDDMTDLTGVAAALLVLGYRVLGFGFRVNI
jgi:hypothetical protein